MLLSKQIMSIPFKPIHYLQKWYNLICLRKVNHLKTGNNEDDSKKLPGETQAAELPLFDLTKDANRVIVSRLLQSVQLSWITSMFVIICLWTLFGARFCLILVLAFHLVSSLFRRSNKLRFEWSNRKRAAAATRIEADLWIQLHRQFPWASLLIGPTQAKQHRQCINQVLHKLWPQIRRNVLESFRVRKLGLGFQCAKIDLGRNAPTIQRLRVNTSKWNDGRWARNNFGDQLSLQLDCDWQAGVGQRLSIKWLFGLWHVKRFSCAFTLYIVMRFRSRNVGGEWIATRISLERAPHWFEYQTEGILLMAMDFFGMLSPFVQMLCSTLLVEPNHVLIQNPKFTNQPQEADESMNDYCLPSGLLQIEVLYATNMSPTRLHANVEFSYAVELKIDSFRHFTPFAKETQNPVICWFDCVTIPVQSFHVPLHVHLLRSSEGLESQAQHMPGGVKLSSIKQQILDKDLNGKEYHIEGAASHTRIRLRICCIELHPRPQSIVLGKHTSQMWTNGLLSVFVNGADGLYSWPMAQKLYGGEYGCQLQLKIGQQNVLLTSRNLGDEQWWNDAIHFTVNQPQIELLQVRVWIETKRNSHGNTTAGMYQFLESEVPELVTDSKDNASKASGKESNERARKTLLLASGKLPVRSLLTHSSPDDQPMLQPIELPLHGRLHQCRLYMLCVYQSVRYKDDLIKAYEESGASAFRFAELEHFTEVDEKHI